ncbi:MULTISPECIES: preprotein translocase subunit YajC [unclassified Streptomyces]|uniref:preprotein translocase subunit YajC n=1 Tax=unclassified Streptomyces TaxID=2593676 RepID=UPI00225ABE02|nr:MULTISPECIES: preprotein translocase subunit YajC [unclassified Streptomyces]MCX5139015.1 preprotein translocase subunit YajC [Streptomyces sp. NBC_00338]WRZ63719.1 preprotein translocase subunit YajC [Streptomyces sp. NBC_01257]WSU57683.1 preprotein translocase subunit YajC [Streptomyces sp. NBC_01104]
MNPVTLLPFIVLIGAMFLMTRSAKKKQAAAANMRNEMQPGTGVRTIGGMYATVKELHDDTVLLEVAPGVHAIYAKNAIGAVLDDAEYNRIVHGDVEELDVDGAVVPDDASSLTELDAAPDEAADDADDAKTDLVKKTGSDDVDAEKADEAGKKSEGKADGEADAK